MFEGPILNPALSKTMSFTLSKIKIFGIIRHKLKFSNSYIFAT